MSTEKAEVITSVLRPYLGDITPEMIRYTARVLWWECFKERHPWITRCFLPIRIVVKRPVKIIHKWTQYDVCFVPRMLKRNPSPTDMLVDKLMEGVK